MPQSYIVGPNEDPEAVLAAAKDLLASDPTHPLWFRSSGVDELPGANKSPVVLLNAGTTVAEIESAIATASLDGKSHWLLQRGAVTATQYGWGDNETSFYATSHSFNPERTSVTARFGLGMPIAAGAPDSFYADIDRATGEIIQVACRRSYARNDGMRPVQVLITYITENGNLTTRWIDLDDKTYEELGLRNHPMYEGKFSLRDRFHEVRMSEQELYTGRQPSILPFTEDTLTQIATLTTDFSNKKGHPVQIEGNVSPAGKITLFQIRKDHLFANNSGITIPEVEPGQIIAELSEVMAPVDHRTDLLVVNSAYDMDEIWVNLTPDNALFLRHSSLGGLVTDSTLVDAVLSSGCRSVITTGGAMKESHLAGSMRLRRGRGEETFYGAVLEGRDSRPENGIIKNVRIVSDGKRGLVYRLDK